ncbi:MAG TPA: formate dehydrogenase subunit delta [Steroidobacteraceae bacterium]
MNIDLLIKMTNEIGDFFAGTADAQQAARDVANHLKRYWEPRMRAQMIAYYEQRQGAGLTDIARNAVAQLAAAAAAGAPSQGTKA